jgi:hypothetical protein
MKFNFNITGPPEPVEPNSILSEARARIIWGESASSIRDFLTAHGVSEQDADAKIKEFKTERNATIRRVGIKNVLLGAIILSASGILLYLAFKHPHIYTNGLRRRSGSSLGVLIFGVFYGLWKLVNGIIYLVRPQSEDASIPDIPE